MPASSKLVPTDPHSSMVIRKVSDNITTLSLPFARFGRIRIGGRATLIRLPSGSVAVFSPVALTADAKAAAARLGPVRYVTAIDLEHHIFMADWHAAFPDATLIAPEGLREKRARQGDAALRLDVVFKDGQTQSGGGDGKLSVDPDFDAAFDMEYVGSHGNRELVFNFRPERTLVQGDLFFNLPALEQYSNSRESPHAGLATRLFNGAWGTTGSALTWQRRIIWYLIAQDRRKFAESVERIYRWDFDRVIPCHGDVIESGGKGVFKSVFLWFLKAE